MSEAWAAALEAAAAARVTLVLGANDTGKTTLVTRLASALAEAGHRVGVVDADLGQSDVGPPTTVGLGHVRRPLERLADAELVALEFLGTTSPARCMRETAEATARLVRRALDLGDDRVLVDTSGLVEGSFGRALKRIKIDRVRPDVLVALQRADEVEPILQMYAEAGRPEIVRLPAAATARRSATARRHARRRALEAHLAGAVPITLDLARVDARPAPAARGLTVIEAEGVLVGLDDGDGERSGWAGSRDRCRRVARLTDATRTGAGRGHGAGDRARAMGQRREPGARAPAAPHAARRPSRGLRGLASYQCRSGRRHGLVGSSRSAAAWSLGGVDGMAVVGGDADGLGSPGRSPTRSVLRLTAGGQQPAAERQAQKPVSILSLRRLLLWGCVQPRGGCNGHAASRRLDRDRHNYYQCGHRQRADDPHR